MLGIGENLADPLTYSRKPDYWRDLLLYIWSLQLSIYKLMVNIVTTDMSNPKRSAVVFPKNQKVLSQLGENIQLARKRRNDTQTLISERTGLSRLTIRKIERGDPKSRWAIMWLCWACWGWWKTWQNSPVTTS